MPPFEDDTNYSVIGKDAPSTCEYLGNEKVLYWIKDVQMPVIDEECASIRSGETASADMLNLVYGGDSKSDNDDCGSSDSILICKDPYLTESIVFKKNSLSSLTYSAQNSPTTINGYVKVDRALDNCFSDHSGQDQTQTTSTTTASREGSFADHCSVHTAPSSANETVNDETALDSCNTCNSGDCFEYDAQDYDQAMSTKAASIEGSYIDYGRAQMVGSRSRDQTSTFPRTTSEESIKDCSDDDLPYVALSEDVLDCSPLSTRSSPEGDVDCSAYTGKTYSDKNSILLTKSGDYIDGSNAT